MPCNDGGPAGDCYRVHLKDASVAQLKAELASRTASKKRAAQEKKNRKAQQAYRAKQINLYLTRAVAAFDACKKIKGNVIVIFAEDDRTETYTWKGEKLMEELRKWLEACKRFPQDMTFRVRYENDRLVLWSWHTHKESA